MSRLLSERVDAMLGGLGWAGAQAAWKAVAAEVPDSPLKREVADTWESDLSEVITARRPPAPHRDQIRTIKALRTWLQGWEACEASTRPTVRNPAPVDRVIAVHGYPTNKDPTSRVRVVAHALKNVPNSEAIVGLHALNLAAEAMCRLIPPDALLIPIPGADGKTGANWHLARTIVRFRNAEKIANVDAHAGGLADELDVLAGPVRASSYTRKVTGRPALTVDEIGTYVPAHFMDILARATYGADVYLVDNVYDTGATVEAARRALRAAGVTGAIHALVWATTKPLFTLGDTP